MKKAYVAPSMEFVHFDDERIIAESCQDFDEDCPNEDGEGFGGCTTGQYHTA